jgi:hypothetical protein
MIRIRTAMSNLPSLHIVLRLSHQGTASMAACPRHVIAASTSHTTTCLPAHLLGRLPLHHPSLPAPLPPPSDKYKKSQRTAAGADKWLDTRLWDSTAECLGSLKAAGFQIVTTHLSASSITIQVGGCSWQSTRDAVTAADAMTCKLLSWVCVQTMCTDASCQRWYREAPEKQRDKSQAAKVSVI